MATNSRSRKWVVRAMISFIVILALLTFFSNTIMNATIPKVMGANAIRGNLSYSNSATGTIEANEKTDIKSIEGRTIDKVNVTYLDYVTAGDVLFTLKDVEDDSSLKELQNQLTELERARDYDARTPAEQTDYVSLQEAINTAEENLANARETLAAAETKEETIDAANDIISENSTLAISLAAEVESASDTVEELNAEISRLEAEIETRQQQIDILVDLGIPTPTPTPVPGIEAARPVKRANDEGEPSDTEPAESSETTPSETEPSVSETEATETTPEETEEINPSTERIGELQAEIDEREEEIEELQSQLADAQGRLDSAAAELADVNAAIEEAQAAIAAADALPSVSSAQSAVNLAQSSVNSAMTTYSNTQVIDGINYDKAQDAINDRNEQIAELEEKIEKLEEQMEMTEVKAPVSGYVYNITVADGDVMTADQVTMYIVPDDATYSVSFTFDTTVAQTFSPGMTLTTDKYWVESCIISTIKPDATNPRDKRVVKCALQADYMWPGETLTATADRSNADYEHVIASSAVNEDNSGTFVYVIQEASSPLGDKYTVKRVDVTIEAEDGALTAISGNGIDSGMIVIRSEEPLQDGDRVRLEDYSSK